MNEQSKTKATVRMVTTKSSWIEGEAERQLHHTAALEGMRIGVGLPDLHPGKGTPVGAAFFGERLYPHVVGNDVGCGIGLWKTSLQVAKSKRDKWIKKLEHLSGPRGAQGEELLQKYGIGSSVYDSLLGTIGAGNHFAELQRIEAIHCKESFLKLGLDHNSFYLLVHSGSRGIGEALLRSHAAKYGAKGLSEESEDGCIYKEKHNFAVHWAKCNRSLVAKRFSQRLKASCEPVLDSCHNSIEKTIINGQPGWLHRKGASPSDRGVLVIPGSRGSLSYIVSPVGDQSATLWSLPHGAGRKWNRKSCKGRLKTKYSSESLQRTAFGSVVLCDDKELLYEEAPQAYKQIESVIFDIESQGLVNVIATLRPLITYKRKN